MACHSLFHAPDSLSQDSLATSPPTLTPSDALSSSAQGDSFLSPSLSPFSSSTSALVSELPPFSGQDAPYDLHRLDAENALVALEFFLKSFALTPRWRTPAQRHDWIHDIALMLQLADLHAVSLEMLDPLGNLLLRFRIEFRSPEDPSPIDPARGFELPCLPTNSVASYRLLLGPLYRFYDYAHRLRSRWRSASPLPQLPPNVFLSRHLQTISFQRLSAAIFVSDLARREGAILTVSPAADFALASCADLPLPVFLHRSECDRPFLFQPAQKVSFVLIHTPRGYQGRNIRPA